MTNKRILVTFLLVSMLGCSTYRSISIDSPLTAGKKYRVVDWENKKHTVKAEENIFPHEPIIYQEKDGFEKVISRSGIKDLEVRREDYALRQTLNILIIIGGVGLAVLTGLGIYAGTQLD